MDLFTGARPRDGRKWRFQAEGFGASSARRPARAELVWEGEVHSRKQARNAVVYWESAKLTFAWRLSCREDPVAEFRVHSLEGTQYIDAHLTNEMIRVEAGALSYFTGDITIRSRLIPSIGGLVKSLIADEAVYRPTYTGTGVVTLESALGGFHVLDLNKETWILEPGAYWASEQGVEVSFHPERVLTSLWAGEGLVYLQTKVQGSGKVVVTTRGPIEEIELGPGKRVVAEGVNSGSPV